MSQQDVIADQTPDEAADDLLLADVFARQRALADGEEAIAQLLYRMRALFVGGMCLPWGLLGAMKQREYVMEAKRLIQEVE